MVDIPRKKSPRAPSLSLDEALERATKAYERERLHPAPTEVVAQNIGYKGANNGRALGALASLRYFGLLERPKEGLLAVTKDVEAYKFAPDESLRHQLLTSFVRRPQLYCELLDKYESGLPSDGNLKFELIQRGFAPAAAEAVLAAFKRSVEFAGYYESVDDREQTTEDVSTSPARIPHDSVASSVQRVPATGSQLSVEVAALPETALGDTERLDRIPVRLPGGRRAWLLIPTPFFDADKDRLKAQIDLLLTAEDERGKSNAMSI